MPDDLDALLLRLRAQHSEPAPRKWKSPIEARLVDDDDEEEDERDDDELHTKTIEYGCADGAGGNERGGGGGGGQRCSGGTGTEAYAVGQDAHDARAGDVELPQQRTRSASLAAEAPPPVPGHLADRQRPPEVDPYSPDRRLYSRKWLAEFDRRCAEAVAQMTAAIERARNGR